MRHITKHSPVVSLSIVCCRLLFSLVHQKQSAWCRLPNFPRLSFWFFFFHSIHCVNFILPLTHHWSVSSHWSPSFSPGLLFFCCVLSKYTGSSGRPDDESITSRNTRTHSRQLILKDYFQSRPFFLVFFSCWFYIFFLMMADILKVLYQLACVSSSPHLKLDKGFSS